MPAHEHRTEDEAKADETTDGVPPAPAAAPGVAAAVSAAPAAASSGGTASGYHYYGGHHGYYAHYPHYQYHATTHHPFQEPQYPADDLANMAAGNLSSMKKMPLKTTADNADKGNADEFGGLSGRKLDQTFAEPGLQPAPNAVSPKQQQQQQQSIKNSSNCKPRAPTPLLLTPDQSTDGKSIASKTSSEKPSGREGENTSASPAADTGTADPPSSKLAELDAMACHSIEAFQATADDVAAFDPVALAGLLGASAASSISCGQVGFRCSHCFDESNKGTTKAELGVVYPSSVGTISSSLRAMRDRHFCDCEAMPDESKSAFSDAQRKQEEEDAASGRSGGHVENGGPTDEWRRIAFLEFCVDFCRRKGIVNKQPQGSGLVYSTTESVANTGNEAEDDSTAGLNAAAAVLAMARPNVTPLTSKRDRGEEDTIQHSTSEPRGDQEGPEATKKGAETGATGASNNPESHFFPDGYGAWICRYCCSVPYPYRGAGSVWSSPNQSPPTKEFVEQHVNVCRGGYGPPPPQPTNATGSATVKGPSIPYTPRTPKAVHQGGVGTTPKPSHHGAGTPHSQYHASPRVALSPQVPPLGPPPPYYGHHYPYPPPPPHNHNQYPPPYGRQSGPPKMPARGGGARAATTSQADEKLPAPPGVDGSGSEASVQAAVDYLNAVGGNVQAPPPTAPQVELIVGEDKLLLTDYFCHLIRQLRLVRFSEKDRKTRGGKRENVTIGYGGLECIHCSGAPSGRKFFWSNVDRLANSFAEIPGHVLKCKRCPPQTKASLLELKLTHSAQMSKLPRGSQKVFFRRMWRRIHEGDPAPGAILAPPVSRRPPIPAPPADTISRLSHSQGSSTDGAMPPLPDAGNAVTVPSSTEQRVSQSLASLAGVMRTPIAPRASRASGGPGDLVAGTADRSPIMGPHERLKDNFVVDVVSDTAEIAAKALAHSAAAQSTGVQEEHPIIMLAIKEDKEWLSDNDCFIRRNVEVFSATEKDVLTAKADRKQPVKLGQVGIRCIHCAVALSRYSDGKRGARGSAVSFPYSISGIYESVREFQRMHLESCPHLPDDVRVRLSQLKGASSLSSVLRRYYVMAAKALGMVDSKEGIRAGGESTSLGSSAEHEFAKSTQGLALSSIVSSARTSTPSGYSSTGNAPTYGGENYNYPPTQPHIHPHPPPPPPHYGYYYNYAPHGAVPGSFLQSAITPLESRKRKAPRETTQIEQGSSKKAKTESETEANMSRVESV
mmetsp:Transcript_26244/g.56870  ORF Transcript_26244/g.56870 Transcript_26244/m.56870 type:complete len:1234 (-) Transcript_26244:138-3839(-)